jgi:protein-disulfide isomerase
LVCSGAFIAYRNLSANKTQKLLLNNLPEITFSGLDRNSVSLKSLIKDQPNILIYFNSTCPICQSEAELLVTHFAGDNDINFMFVSSEPLAQVAKFEESYMLNQLPNRSVASDTLYQLANHFKLTSVPATIVYDRNGELVEFFKGAVSMSALKSAIQKAHDSAR